MRHYSVLLIAFGLVFLTFGSSRGQRAVGAKSLILDDGSGNTLTISYPNIPPVIGNSFFNFLPGGGSTVPNGTANGQTLWWNNETSVWTADNFLTNTGLAIGINTTTPTGELANTNLNPTINGVTSTTFGLNWQNSDAGWSAIFQNTNSGGPNFNGIAISLADNSSSSDALWVQSGTGHLMDMTADGTLSVGSSNQLQVDNSGNLTTSGTTTLTSVSGGVAGDFSGSYSVGTAELFVSENMSGGTITLPASPSSGRTLMIRNTSTGSVFIDGNGNNIDGFSPYTLAPESSATFNFPSGVTIVYDGFSGWWVVGEGN